MMNQAPYPRMPDLDMADTTTEVRLQSAGFGGHRIEKNAADNSLRLQADLTAVNWDTKEVLENVCGKSQCIHSTLSSG